ncbi:MAG TPA: ATP-binding protein [Gemmatimonadales bacterium]
MGTKPSLRTELLFNLAFLAAAALLLGVATILALEAIAPDLSPGALFPLVLLTVAVDVAVFIVFGRYLVARHVVRPVERLVAVADAVAAGDLAARAPDAETLDFSTLAARLNRMTDHLLDAQGRLVRTEKLASLGLLAAGLAHEIGNPLGALGTYAEVLRRRGADPEVMAGMTRELERVDRIIRGLLDYARPREEALAPIDPGAVARGVFELLQAQGALKRAQASLDLGTGVPRVLGRAHSLEQALVNLLLNAVDAAAGRPVVIGARRWAYESGHAAPRRAGDPGGAEFDRPAQGERRPADFQPGEIGALLFVADGGSGVPPEDRGRVFEPFFTTKPPGQGTGLGLAIVARAVHDMGGVIWVDAAREGGAAFKIFLPAARP